MVSGLLGILWSSVVNAPLLSPGWSRGLVAFLLLQVTCCHGEAVLQQEEGATAEQNC